ncbi:FG-GAP repeat domain-containing protein [Gimesia panareensis]|uniref:FG-GAP repeat domain-containing protein n=1 Tax=Gimesia panareensis TaxID=2527978 RepID=UPI00118D24FB|nr:VCBS repeat-containing protein [Gimesia panareensis]QDU53389.1 FG-GAP repeat protein [Gimesia panareensis]
MFKLMRKVAHVSCLLASLTVLTPLPAGEPDRGDPWPIHIIDDSSRGADGVKLFDLDRDGLLDLTTGWEEGGVTRIYRNPGPDRAKLPWPALTVGKTPHVEDAAWIDLERNGRKAVVSCCEGKTRAVFVHWAPYEKPFEQPWQQAVIPASKDRMMWMFAVPAKLSLDARGGEELVAAGKGPGAEIGWFECTAEARDLSNYKWHPLSPAGWIMSLYMVDMDGDGDQDILTTDRKGKLRGCRWLENPGFVRFKGEKWKNHWVGGRDREVMFAHLADLDQDGLQDVLFVSRNPDEVHWYRRLDKSGQKWEHQVVPYPENTGGGKGVAVGDLDRDGQLDLVLSCEHAEPPKSGMFWMRGSRKGEQFHWEPREISGPKGIKYDRIELLDLDADGDLDVICCEERHQKRGLGLFWYENPQLQKDTVQSKKSSR